MSERDYVQLALRQTLENLQRCGLRWLPSSTEIPEQWVEALNNISDGSAEPVQAAPVSTATQAATPIARSTATTSPRQSQPSISSKNSQDSHPKLASGSTSSLESTAAFAGQSITKKAAITIANGQSWKSDSLDDSARLNLLQKLDQEVRACRKCTEICSYRQQTVFGTGPIRPTVCFMGEAPGADEDKQGLPFVGRAGQLLTRIIQAMQLKREEVYILNSLKCRPPGNRNPSPDEINNCFPFVESQLETLRPSYIVCLGAIAVRSLLKTDSPVGQLRGKFFNYRGAKVLVTYHPSYLLRNESAKKLVWEDMQILMRELGIELPQKR